MYLFLKWCSISSMFLFSLWYSSRFSIFMSLMLQHSIHDATQYEYISKLNIWNLGSDLIYIGWCSSCSHLIEASVLGNSCSFCLLGVYVNSSMICMVIVFCCFCCHHYFNMIRRKCGISHFLMISIAVDFRK